MPPQAEEPAPPSQRTTIKRAANRGAYDRETICQILDAGFLCHVGFLVDNQPRMLPTIHARVGDHVYLHGAPGSQMLQVLAAGGEACVCVTHVDGLVLARSALHHSLNYRSVVLFGHAREVRDLNEKNAVLRALTEHVIPGRWNSVRPPSESELRGTRVLGIPIDEASAKIRTGPPKDAEADYALPVWAGVLPLRSTAGIPLPDPLLPSHIAVPEHIARYRQNHTPGSSRNVALVERFYDQLWNRFDKSVIPQLLTETFRFRGSLGQVATGYQEFAAYVDRVQAAFPDFSNHVEEIISEGDLSAVRLTYRGTHQGEFSIPSTDRRVECVGQATFRFRDSRIDEVWVLGDLYRLLEQLP